ncbi:polysaccharide pyruvyl transferase family protein [Methanolobus sediminis]|uniref:Polysaccharide pyruvyl transferase family protein n=1 Tax=Methanolobus sediminis TaxID=3072978 RepID=A0AA51UL69_9EURY|nr:polysaccharide pyruvyl transferase family protein [Methanolobus sediminis]WMW25425.1 polysaccharide pyruvyl transferase family protein [Methanolobus sediminis]
MTENPSFILAGNGPYENRGCEAIVRGTVKILREHFNDPSLLCFDVFSPETRHLTSIQDSIDSKIMHMQIYNYVKPHSKEKLIRIFLRLFNSKMKSYRPFHDMVPELQNHQAVLSIGGDNYSLDYGIPKLFTDLDDIVQYHKKPLIIWGASVGPFDEMPEYKQYMINHLKNVTAIFSRESATTDYLKKNGISKNVYEVADPAYLLEPIKPASNSLNIEESSIGINLSPLMAKYVCEGDINLWEKKAASIVSSISETTGKTIYLIPHVTTPYSNDYVFMKNMLSHIKDTKKLILIDPIYNASETKWIISQLSFFAGARTHSTIAALSSGIPTLSFAYSMKAIGINKDLFGHDSYCLSPKNLDQDKVIEKMSLINLNEKEIVEHLNYQVPIMKEKAMNAGKYLKQILT